MCVARECEIFANTHTHTAHTHRKTCMHISCGCNYLHLELYVHLLRALNLSLKMLFRDENLWIFGMLLNIAGSVTVNFGTNLMKSAHNIVNKQESNAAASGGIHTAVPQKKHDEETEGCTTEFIWNMGMFAFVFGSIVNFASFAFAAQSLLACLGTVQFVSNVFFAKFVLKETLTPRIIFATTVIISGLTVAILCSNHATLTYSTADLRDLYTARYGIFMLFVVSFLLLLQACYMYYINNEEHWCQQLSEHKAFCNLNV